MSRRDYSNWTEQNYIDAVKSLNATTQEDLRRKDVGLYFRMKNEGLLESIVPKKEQELTLENFVNELEAAGIKTKRELMIHSRSKYMLAKNKGFLEKVFGVKPDYSSITPEEFVQKVRELGAVTKQDLRYLDSDLCKKGTSEGWISLAFKKKQPEAYSGMTLDNFLKKVETMGARLPIDVQRFNPGLFNYIRERRKKWFEIAFPEYAVKKNGISFDECKKIIGEKGYYSPADLRRRNKTLYARIERAGFMDQLYNIRSVRSYENWTRGEFITAVHLLRASSSADLKKKDRGLHEELSKRELLEVIFFDYKPRKTKGPQRKYTGWTDEDYKREIEKIGAKTKSELAEKDHGLYKRLKNIKSINNFFSDQRADKPIRPKRTFYNKSDDEILEFYRQNYSNITSKKELQEIDPSFCLVLGRRKLFDMIFKETSIENILESYVNGSDDL